MITTNPFTERGRITNAERFVGRWSELGLVFERLEATRPVLIAGTPGIGMSSLLTHITQAAAVNLEVPELRAYYLDLYAAEGTAQVYATLAQALGQRGDTLAALELGLVAVGDPVLVCLDNAHAALAAGWGEGLLDALARVARGGQLLLVVGLRGAAPQLSERFATLKLGAFAQTEVRLLAETYLDGTDVSFSPAELRDLIELSAAHPAYVQRAAFYLFQSKLDAAFDWRAAYRAEVRDRPVPGAPLPAAVFEGGGPSQIQRSSYGDTAEARAAQPQQLRPLPEMPPLVNMLVAVAAALLGYLASGSWPIALVLGLVAVVAYTLWARPRRAP